jgi:WD40 repeat protein
VLDRVIAGPPRPLPMVVPSVPGELATIVRKAMARDPAARYPHAVALAEDLRRFTTGKLVSAHSYSTWALLRKRLSRHRGIVAVVVASLVVLGAVGIESVRRVVAERNIARSALISAERRKRELVLLQAETALPRDPTAALAWLKGYRLGPDDRTKVVDVIDEALALGVARHVFRPGDWVIDVRFTPDGKTVVAAVRDGILRAYNVRTGTVTELGKTPSVPTALTMTGDGAFAITGGATGEVIAWPLRGGTPRMVLEPGGRAISRLRLSGDGRVLVERDWSAPQVVSLEGGAPDVLAPTFGLKFAVAERDWSHVVMATSATELVVPDPTGARALAHTDMAIEFLAVSPRGDTVIVHDGTTIWSVPYAGGELHEVARYKDKLHTVVWSDDGRTMAIGGALPEILMVDTQTGATTELRGHTDAIYTLELSHDGTQLLSASDDATARVWRLANRTATVLRGHDDDVYSARFSADERSVATASLDGSARVWDIDRPSSSTFVEAEPIEAVRFDGASALATTRDVIARWNFATGQREQLFEAEADAHGFGASVVSPDGERVVVPHPDGSLELRDRDGNTATLRGHHGLVTHVEFTHDGSALYSSSNDGTLRRWSVATGAGSIVLEGATPIRGFAVARDGRIAAQAGEAAYLIDPTGAVSQLGKGGSWCIKFAEFEPISDRLALYRCDGTLALYDRGKLVELATGGYAVTHIAVSRDGRLIAGGLTDRTVRLWSADSGRVLDILHGHSDLVLDVAFSPDGETLASASYDKTIGLWDLTSRRHRVLRGHTAAVNWLVWRGSAHLATGSSDGTIRVWDVPSLALPSESEIAARLNGATSAQIDLDRPESSAQVTRGT